MTDEFLIWYYTWIRILETAVIIFDSFVFVLQVILQLLLPSLLVALIVILEPNVRVQFLRVIFEALPVEVGTFIHNFVVSFNQTLSNCRWQ